MLLPDVVDHPFPPLEGADPVPGPPRRVVCFDGRGNGRSDRPGEVTEYAEREYAADALAVMDATGTERAFLVALSAGALWGVLLAAQHPERRGSGMVIIAPAAPFAQHTARAVHPFDEPRETHEGWAKWNRFYWLEHYREFLEFFFGEVFSEPHSTKQVEDCVGWGLDTTPETLALTVRRPRARRRRRVRAPVREVSCPVLVLHGDDDRSVRWSWAARGRGDRRRARRAGGLRSLPARARPGARQPPDPRVRRARAARRAAGRAGARAASARSSCPRRSGSATRGATSRSRAELRAAASRT